MTNYMKNKLNKEKTIYELHDEDGCIRKFKCKQSAIIWKSTRPELKLIIIKPKVNIDDIEEAIF